MDFSEKAHPLWERGFFVLACHHAISKPGKGMSHHNEVRHVSTRLHTSPHSSASTMGTSAAAGSVCFLTNACGIPIAHFERFCSPAGWSCGTRA